MKVSVIIINYNTFQLTSNCIRSVLQHTKGTTYEIILVDNASSECDPGLFLKEFPSVRLVRNHENSGFAKGNNLGITQCSGEYILLLNSDTMLTEDSITRSIDFMDTNPGIGVLGSRMIYPDGRIQYSARRFRSISWELLDLFRFIPMVMPYRKRARLMLGRYFRHDETLQCDWVNGAFFLFRRSILEKLEGHKLDDRFFMYAEDQLWCEQIKKLGHEVMFFADTTIIHINSGSTVISKQIALREAMARNELAIMKGRKGKGLYYILFRFLFLMKEKSRNLIKSIAFRLTGKVIR